jgi:hypothetical protein
MKEQRIAVIIWISFLLIPILTLYILFLLLFGLDAPVDYQLPQTAQVIEEKSSPSDVFGDYSYGAIFRIPPSEVKVLTAKGFDWVTFDFSLEEKPQWKTGKLDSMILKQIKDGNFGLKDSPDHKKNYKYIYHNGNQGFRIFAIDEAQDKVYYYRATW